MVFILLLKQKPTQSTKNDMSKHPRFQKQVISHGVAKLEEDLRSVKAEAFILGIYE
jgi:hypothetical protein